MDRRRFLGALGLLAGTAGLAACQAPAPAAPTAPGPAATSPPSAAGARAGTAGWERQWDELIAAARGEGKLAVFGPPAQAVRTDLTAAFKNRFGIEIEYVGGNTADIMTRLEAERPAGQYTVDVILGGAQSFYTRAYPGKMLDPIPPVLIHPDATDPTKWVAGRLWYMDPEQQYVLRLSNQVATGVTVNTQYVRPDEITSWRDLLDPKYRGRISAYDPTVAGQGWAPAAYLLRMLGEDYVRAFYQDQQPLLTRDYRQLADAMAHGTHPISLGVSSRDGDALRRDGFAVQRVRELPEAPSTVSAGFGLLVLVNRAPNPNAAKLFVNWIATREGGEVFSRADGTVSARADVDSAAWAPADAIPRSDVPYFDSYGWEYTLSEFTPEKLERMRRIVGRT